jgi:isopenicillin N synthase-like dioxygenase
VCGQVSLSKEPGPLVLDLQWIFFRIREVGANIEPYLEGDPAAKSFVANSIDRACREIGIFIITGHPLCATVIEQLWAVSSEFFNLPPDVKMKYKKPHRGYSAVGSRAFSYSRGIKTPPDLREGFNTGPFNFLDDDYHRNGRRSFCPKHMAA